MAKRSTRRRRAPTYRPMKLSPRVLEALLAVDSDAVANVVVDDATRETIPADDAKEAA